MARPLRLECADTPYHVLARGNERRTIYRDDADRQHFLDLLGACCERFEIGIWSYVLMDNHYHLVLETLRANLSRAMQWLGVAYTVWHNRRHERAGHLFQGRFKSFIVERGGYLERLLLYTHRNPLRAGLVERLADYRWSSYPCLAYGRGCVPWLDRGRVLGLFGGDATEFRRAVQGYSGEEASLFENLREGLFLGSLAGFRRLLSRAKPELHPEKPQSRGLARARSVTEAVEAGRRALRIPAGALGDLRQPVRGHERPLRDALIYLVWREGQHRLREIGGFFHVGYTSIVNARARGERYLREKGQLSVNDK